MTEQKMENYLKSSNGRLIAALQWLLTFVKAQFSALVGGVSDYMLMIILTQYYGLFYVHSIIIGGIFGAVVNYTLNRYWTFQAEKKPMMLQLPKFFFVVIGSITLKSTATYYLKEFMFIDYRIGRLMADVFISIGFNFMLQKYWVFRK